MVHWQYGSLAVRFTNRTEQTPWRCEQCPITCLEPDSRRTVLHKSGHFCERLLSRRDICCLGSRLEMGMGRIFKRVWGSNHGGYAAKEQMGRRCGQPDPQGLVSFLTLARILLIGLFMDAPQHVLVGYDGSPLSELAVCRAFRIVEHSPFALIHVVAVVEEEPGDRVRLPSGELMSRWAALDSIRFMVASLTEPLKQRYPQARVIVHLRSGEVAQALVDCAYRFHVDQIVLGVRGQGSPHDTRLGTVPTAVLSLTEIPTHIESPMSCVPPLARNQTLRWAYVTESPVRVSTYSTHQKERALA
jgi:nucleotide-binding universal stress UspA family protein